MEGRREFFLLFSPYSLPSSLPSPFVLFLSFSRTSHLSLFSLFSLSKKKKTISPAAINCELFSRDPANVSALLALLSKGNGSGEVIDVSSDLGIRYHATATLAALAASHAPRLASAVLSSPGGVGLLLDLLSDSHGAVAGEARPLLLRLARAAPEVQKIAAFEGAFERLLAGARSAASVGEVSAAQDFLQLTAALLERNPATQVLFREGGHTAALPALLSVDGEAAAAGENRNRQNPNKRLTPQRAVVICAALDLVMALVWIGERRRERSSDDDVGQQRLDADRGGRGRQGSRCKPGRAFAVRWHSGPLSPVYG